MIEIVMVCHIGNCTPLYVCELVAGSRNAFLMHLEKTCFTQDNLELLRGTIDISQGVTVVYFGRPVENWIIIRDALIEYVKNNRQRLIEEWQNWRIRGKSG